MKRSLVMFLALTASASAQAAIITPTADTYVASNAANTVEGGTTTMITNVGSNANRRWAYLRFDLSGVNRAAISELKLDLWNTNGGGAGAAGLQYDIYGVTDTTAEAFTETGTGALTWNTDSLRDTTTTPNTLLKSKTTGSALASFITPTPAAAHDDVAFDATSGSPVLNFVQADSDGIVTFVVYEDNPSTAGSGNVWASKEAAGASTTDTTVNHVPMLTVAVPEPGVASLLGVASVLGLIRRRK